MNGGTASSPVVYTVYEAICERTDRDVYTQETVNRHINKAGTYGVLESKRTSGGFKSGVHLQFSFTEPIEAVIETLEADATFDGISLSTVRQIARHSLRQ